MEGGKKSRFAVEKLGQEDFNQGMKVDIISDRL